MPAGKLLLHKYESILGRKCVRNYRAAAVMLRYLQVSTQLEILMDVHQCAQFFNNLRLVHERAVRRITKYPVSTFTYVDLSDGNLRLYIHIIVYKLDKEKVIKCYIYAKFHVPE